MYLSKVTLMIFLIKSNSDEKCKIRHVSFHKQRWRKVTSRHPKRWKATFRQGRKVTCVVAKSI